MNSAASNTYAPARASDRSDAVLQSSDHGRAASSHRCVVVGAGSVGRRHLRNLQALGVHAVALRTHRGQAGALSGWRSLTSWQEVAEERPTLAIVANPTALHADAAIAASQLGCHLLLEKPAADSLEAAQRLALALAAGASTTVMGYQWRFHPTLRRVRDWIGDGVIGTPISARAHWGEYLPDWHPGEDHRLGYSARRDLGGGVVRTLSHPVDYVRWLLGEVASVSAMTARSSGVTVDVEDVASLSLRLTTGVLATITLDYVARPACHTLHVVGSEGTLLWNAITGRARAWHAPTGHAYFAEPETDFERNTMFMDELRHFIACADGVERPLCTLDDGVRAVAIIEAALRAAEARCEIDV